MAIQLPRRPQRNINVNVAQNVPNKQGLIKSQGQIGQIVAGIGQEIAQKQFQSDVNTFATDASFQTNKNVNDQLDQLKIIRDEQGNIPMEVGGESTGFSKKDPQSGKDVPLSYGEAVEQTWNNEEAAFRDGAANLEQQEAYAGKIRGFKSRGTLGAFHETNMIKAKFNETKEITSTKRLTTLANTINKYEKVDKLLSFVKSTDLDTAQAVKDGLISPAYAKAVTAKRHDEVLEAWVIGQKRIAEEYMTGNNKAMASLVQDQVQDVLTGGIITKIQKGGAPILDAKEFEALNEKAAEEGVNEAIDEMSVSPFASGRTKAIMAGTNFEPVVKSATANVNKSAAKMKGKEGDIQIKAGTTVFGEIVADDIPFRKMSKYLTDLSRSRAKEDVIHAKEVLDSVQKINTDTLLNKEVPGHVRLNAVTQIWGSKVLDDSTKISQYQSMIQAEGLAKAKLEFFGKTPEERQASQTDFAAFVESEVEPARQAIIDKTDDPKRKKWLKENLFRKGWTGQDAVLRDQGQLARLSTQASKMWNDDPARMAQAYDESTRSALQRRQTVLQDPQATPQARAKANQDLIVAQRRAYSAQLVPAHKWKYLSDNDTTAIASAFQKAPGATFDGQREQEIINGLQTDYGTSAPVVFQEMIDSGKLPKENAEAIQSMMYLPLSGATVAKSFTSAAQSNVAERAKSADFSAILKEIGKSVDKEIAPYSLAIQNANNTTSGTNQQFRVQTAVRKVAEDFAASNPGTDSSEAVSYALESVLERNYNVVQSDTDGQRANFYVPGNAFVLSGLADRGISNELIAKRSEEFIKKVDVYKLADPKMFKSSQLSAAGIEITPEERPGRIRDVLDMGTWRTMHDNTGIAYMIQAEGNTWTPVRTKDGGTISFDWRTVATSDLKNIKTVTPSLTLPKQINPFFKGAK